jgi:hypothetical protein
MSDRPPLRYFFMRKLWFSHLARALVVFPGGFGTRGHCPAFAKPLGPEGEGG